MPELLISGSKVLLKGEAVETAAMKRSKGARRRRLSYVVDEKDVSLPSCHSPCAFIQEIVKF